MVLILAAAVAVAVAADPQIVVTGVPLSRLKADAEACIAQQCPAKQDIDLSIRYAEGLFKTGRYAEARRTLTATASRTKGARLQEPIAVSELYLALANVAAHDGERRIVRRATYDRAAVLRDSLPADAPEKLLADMSIVDLQMRDGDYPRAARGYAGIADRAKAAGEVRIFAALKLRQASLAHTRQRPAEADALLAELSASTDLRLRPYRLAARAFGARLARERGDKQATDRFLAELAREPQRAAPLLLWSPPIAAPSDPVEKNKFEVTTDSASRSSDYTGTRWADIGYWIKPDGTVETPEILRGTLTAGRAGQVLASIAGRRYASFAGGEEGGQYRAERVTLTADYAVPVGSLIRRRFNNPHYEFLDITGGAPELPREQAANTKG